MTVDPALLTRWINLDQEIREKTEEKAKLSAEMAADMTPGDEVRLPDGGGVRLMPGVGQFSHDVAYTVLPADVFAHIAAPRASAQLARDFLPPALYDLCKKPPGDPYLRKI